MEVPLAVKVAVVLVCHADLMPDPGAKTSRQVPTLENQARASLISVAPTVSAAGVLAGE
jgi:hypothetical protein